MWVEPYEIMRYASEQVRRLYPNFDVATVPSKLRNNYVTYPRQLFWALLYGAECLSHPRIAAMTGGWNHTTIMHGCEAAKERVGLELVKILCQELGAWIDYQEAFRSYEHRRLVAASKGYIFKKGWEPKGVRHTRRVFNLSRNIALMVTLPVPPPKKPHRKITAEQFSERGSSL